MIGGKSMAVIFSAIAILAVVGVLLISLSGPSAHQQEYKKQGSPSTYGDTKPNVDEDSQQQSDTRTENQKNQNYWERFLSYIDERDKAVTALSTIAVAAFTFFLFIATVLLFYSAEKSAKIANASLVKLQRAFIGIQQIRYLSHTDPDNGKVWWSFHVMWENSGASPTRNFSVYVGRYLADTDIPTTFSFDPPKDEKLIPTVIGPKGTVGSGEIHIDGDDLAAVGRGEKFFYIWGVARYRDVFDSTPDHVTRFFVRATDVRGNPTVEWNASTNAVEVILAGQPTHNCADEECTDQGCP